jgi:hypothetical protein
MYAHPLVLGCNCFGFIVFKTKCFKMPRTIKRDVKIWAEDLSLQRKRCARLLIVLQLYASMVTTAAVLCIIACGGNARARSSRCGIESV